jgi:hypothetical protein
MLCLRVWPRRRTEFILFSSRKHSKATDSLFLRLVRVLRKIKINRCPIMPYKNILCVESNVVTGWQCLLAELKKLRPIFWPVSKHGS